MKNKKTKKKTPTKKPNPVGRPPFYKSAEVMQKKIDAYFKNPPRRRKLFFQGEEVGEVPIRRRELIM